MEGGRRDMVIEIIILIVIAITIFINAFQAGMQYENNGIGDFRDFMVIVFYALFFTPLAIIGGLWWLITKPFRLLFAVLSYTDWGFWIGNNIFKRYKLTEDQFFNMQQYYNRILAEVPEEKRSWRQRKRLKYFKIILDQHNYPD